MDEVNIWSIPRPEITIEDVFKVEGANYSQRPPRPKTLELHQRILSEAAELINPIVIWREVNISHVDGHKLYLEEGGVLTSPLLTKIAGLAEQLILTAMTIGNALEERLDTYKQEGKASEAFALDAAGTAYITRASTLAFNTLENLYHKRGLNTTFPMGPGHSYWPRLEDLQVIFNFLRSEEIDLRLTDSNFILPRKSAAMVLGVGQYLPDSHSKSHCNFCSLQTTCPLSQAGTKTD